MKKAIITGAGGFIGKALSKRLLKENYEVWGIDVDLERFKEMSGKHFHGLISDAMDYENVELPHDADLFYHLAWGGISSRNYNQFELQRRNFLTATNAAETAVNIECRKFIFVGSSHENLIGVNSINGKETNGNIYGVAKKCARIFCEFICKDKIAFNSTAFTNVFGVGDYSKRTTNMFIHKMLSGEPIDLVEGSNLYDWIYIDDAVEGLYLAGTKGVSSKQYYIGNDQPRAFKSIISQVRDVVNPNIELRFGTYSDDTYIDYAKFDLNALRKDTGFECRCDFKESILKTVEWVKNLDF